MEPRVIPNFATEAEEAQWWFDHRDELAQDFADAAKAGRLRKGVGIRFASERGELASEESNPEPTRRAS